MDAKRIQQIKEVVEWENDFAVRTLNGDTDNYDGADGARTVRNLCSIINELLVEVEKKP